MKQQFFFEKITIEQTHGISFARLFLAWGSSSIFRCFFTENRKANNFAATCRFPLNRVAVKTSFQFGMACFRIVCIN